MARMLRRRAMGMALGPTHMHHSTATAAAPAVAPDSYVGLQLAPGPHRPRRQRHRALRPCVRRLWLRQRPQQQHWLRGRPRRPLCGLARRRRWLCQPQLRLVRRHHSRLCWLLACRQLQHCQQHKRPRHTTPPRRRRRPRQRRHMACTTTTAAPTMPAAVHTATIALVALATTAPR